MKPTELFRTSTFRLALAYMVLFIGSVLLLLGFIYWSSISQLSRQLDRDIDDEIQWMIGTCRKEGMSSLIDRLAVRIDADRGDDRFYAVIAEDDWLLAGNLPAILVRSVMRPGRRSIRGVDRDRFLHLRVRTAEACGYRFVAGMPMHQMMHIHRLIVPVLSWGMLIMAVLAVLGGIVMSRSVAGHIEQINRAVREIMEGDLSRRVPVSGGSDDFDLLAISLNAMLDEIEQLMAGTRTFSHSVAHELRTPLTRMRNRLERLQKLAGMQAAVRDEVEGCIQDADRLLTSFNALLRIARIESGGYRPSMQLVDPVVMIEDACDLYAALAEEKRIELIAGKVDVPPFLADRDLLFQAIVNLLDNAVKYTPGGGRIRISTVLDGQEVVISVADNGPGIAERERANVTRHFYRIDDGRNKEGTGLGLSLVAAVAHLHGGTLVLADNHPGLVASIRLTAAFGSGAA